jgi:hypothetical protein
MVRERATRGTQKRDSLLKLKSFSVFAYFVLKPMRARWRSKTSIPPLWLMRRIARQPSHGSTRAQIDALNRPGPDRSTAEALVGTDSNASRGWLSRGNSGICRELMQSLEFNHQEAGRSRVTMPEVRWARWAKSRPTLRMTLQLRFAA